MKIETRFDIGDTVWAATKHYDQKDSYNTETSFTCFYYWKLSEMMVIKNIMIDILDNGKPVIMYLMENDNSSDILGNKSGYYEDSLFDDEEVARSIVDVNNRLVRVAKEDFQAKYVY